MRAGLAHVGPKEISVGRRWRALAVLIFFGRALRFSLHVGGKGACIGSQIPTSDFSLFFYEFCAAYDWKWSR